MVTLCNTAIDWDATGSFLSGVGTLIGATAVFRAADAFATWRKQKIGERHIEQAERILTALYEAHDAMVYARGWLIPQHETETAKAEVEQEQGWNAWSPEKQRRVAFAQTKLNRLRFTRDRQKAMVETLPMAKALFGDELHQAITDYHHQFWVLETYLQAYCHDENGNDPAFTQRIAEALSAPEAGTNEISTKLTSATSVIEKRLLPILREDEHQRSGLIPRWWASKI